MGTVRSPAILANPISNPELSRHPFISPAAPAPHQRQHQHLHQALAPPTLSPPLLSSKPSSFLVLLRSTNQPSHPTFFQLAPPCQLSSYRRRQQRYVLKLIVFAAVAPHDCFSFETRSPSFLAWSRGSRSPVPFAKVGQSALRPGTPVLKSNLYPTLDCSLSLRPFPIVARLTNRLSHCTRLTLPP